MRESQNTHYLSDVPLPDEKTVILAGKRIIVCFGWIFFVSLSFFFFFFLIETVGGSVGSTVCVCAASCNGSWVERRLPLSSVSQTFAY